MTMTETAAPVVRRSTSTMIVTSLVWHAVVLFLIWALVPLSSGSCGATDCDDPLETFFVLVVSVPALTMSWVISVLISVGLTRQALMTALTSGRRLAPAQRSADIWTGTWITALGVATGAACEAAFFWITSLT